LKLINQRRPVPDIVVLFGPPGSGKSKFCYDFDAAAYWKPRGEWWCGYENHSTIVLDDYYAWLPYDTMLRLCDRFPLMLGTKGGQVAVIPKTILFTTNTLPHLWYKESKTAFTWPAMQRRFTGIKWMKSIDCCVDFVDTLDENGVKTSDCYDKFLEAFYLENPHF
jgi:hypothetical protein